MNLSDGEKLILHMLSDIYEHLGVDKGIKPDFVREALYSGNAWALSWQYPGVFEPKETPDEVVHETAVILDMWSLIERSYAQLSPEDKQRIEHEAEPFGTHVSFTGFDGNNETSHMGVAQFFVEHLNRFKEFKDRDFNSHFPESLNSYRRMVAVFEPMRSEIAPGPTGPALNASQIIDLLNAERYRE